MMKATVALLMLMGIVNASPLADVSGPVATEPYDSSLGMKWIGEIFPGQNHTLYGDAKVLKMTFLNLSQD